MVAGQGAGAGAETFQSFPFYAKEKAPAEAGALSGMVHPPPIAGGQVG
jgi:hypothetical protein